MPEKKLKGMENILLLVGTSWLNDAISATTNIYCPPKSLPLAMMLPKKRLKSESLK